MISGTDETKADEGSACPWAHEAGYSDFGPVDKKMNTHVGAG
jgi:hypothetical protein